MNETTCPTSAARSKGRITSAVLLMIITLFLMACNRTPEPSEQTLRVTLGEMNTDAR